MSEMAHDVFISYGREDAALMQQVEKVLLDAGLTIWTDKGIAPGSPSLSGRLTDRAKIEIIGEQIARSFRVKE